MSEVAGEANKDQRDLVKRYDKQFGKKAVSGCQLCVGPVTTKTIRLTLAVLSRGMAKIHLHKDGLLIGTMQVVNIRKGIGWSERITAGGRPFL